MGVCVYIHVHTHIMYCIYVCIVCIVSHSCMYMYVGPVKHYPINVCIVCGVTVVKISGVSLYGLC